MMYTTDILMRAYTVHVRMHVSPVYTYAIMYNAILEIVCICMSVHAYPVTG